MPDEVRSPDGILRLLCHSGVPGPAGGQVRSQGRLQSVPPQSQDCASESSHSRPQYGSGPQTCESEHSYVPLLQLMLPGHYHSLRLRQGSLPRQTPHHGGTVPRSQAPRQRQSQAENHKRIYQRQENLARCRLSERQLQNRSAAEAEGTGFRPQPPTAPVLP